MTINRKIVTSAVSIGAMGALLVGATFALFTDQATSNNNTFSTGNASLLIADDVPPGDPGTYDDSIAGVSFTGIAPGFTEDKDFWLKNDSASEIGLDVTADLADLGGSFHGTDGSLPDKLRVQFRCDTNQDGLGDGGDTVTGNFTVNEWITGGNASLGTIGLNEGASNATTTSDQDELFCRMTATLDSAAGNEIANSDISFDGIFDATQDVP